MKSYKYLHKISNIIDCNTLEDEVCNGGPRVWNAMPSLFECPKPCKIFSYTDSVVEYWHQNNTSNEVSFWLQAGSIKTVGTELLVYDTSDMIGSIGGSFGLFLGLSFFGIISTLLDKLLQLMINIQQKNGIQLR